MDVNLVHAPMPENFDLWSPTRRSVIPIFARQLINCAFKHGAYVAGGFARVLAHHGLFAEATISNEESIMDYLGLNRDEIDLNSGYSACHHNDIDLFFPNVEALKAFWRDIPMKSASMICRGIVSGNGTEIIVNKKVRIQVITRYLAPIDDQLRSFDLYNAMVAFNDKEYIVPEHWKELDDAKMMHVVNWSSPFVVHRIFKWFQKHGYTDLSPATAVEIGPQAIELLGMLKKQPFQPLWGGAPLTHDAVLHRLQPFLKQLTNQDLLMLTAVYPIDAYHGAFRILRNRAGI